MAALSDVRERHAVAHTGAGVTVRRVASIPEFRACEDLQRRVWGEGDIVGVPLLDLLTAQENGGLVLGAFDGRGALLGFVYSFLGLTPAQSLKHCSILLAVDPSHQDLGLGYRLKMAQRDEVLTQGIDLITWTFDPLQSRNGYLNIAKLGAVSSAYRVDVYGGGEGLNAGLETDRLLVEWRLDQPGTLAAGSGWAEARVVNSVSVDPQGVPRSAGFELGLREPVLAVQVPPDLSAVKASDLAHATGWRQDTRRVFLHYFARGYTVRGFRFDRRRPGALPQYILIRDRDPEAATN